MVSFAGKSPLYGPLAGVRALSPPWPAAQSSDSGTAKVCGQAVQKVDGRVMGLPFKPADIGAVDFRIIGESLLRSSALDADPTQIPGHQRTSFHGDSIGEC